MKWKLEHSQISPIFHFCALKFEALFKLCTNALKVDLCHMEFCNSANAANLRFQHEVNLWCTATHQVAILSYTVLGIFCACERQYAAYRCFNWNFFFTESRDERRIVLFIRLCYNRYSIVVSTHENHNYQGQQKVLLRFWYYVSKSHVVSLRFKLQIWFSSSPLETDWNYYKI